MLVFISYMREDAAQVLPIKEGLEKAGIVCWIDTEDIPPGYAWESKIKDIIDQCDYFLVCFSERYNMKTSSYVDKEIQLALNRQHKDPAKIGWIIPVLISGDMPQLPDAIDKPLKMLQWISFTPDNWHISFYRLISAIKPEVAQRGSGLFELERKFTTGTVNDRIDVLEKLASMLDLPEALGLLEKGINDSQESVRVTALSYLRLANEPGAEILARALTNPVTLWPFRYSIVLALSTMREKAAVAVPTILELVEILLKEQNDSVLPEPVQQNAHKLLVSEYSHSYATWFIEALGDIGKPANLINNVLSDVRTSVPEIQTAIQNVLGKMEG